MGRRRRRGGIGSKLLGILSALIGVAILVLKLPAYMWWIFIGVILIFLGWLLFNL